MEEMKLGHGECRKGLQQAVPDMYTLGRSAAGNCAYQCVCAHMGYPHRLPEVQRVTGTQCLSTRKLQQLCGWTASPA